METTIGQFEHPFEKGVSAAASLQRGAVSAAAQRWRSILRAGSAQARGSVPPLLLDECTVWAVGSAGASKTTRLGFLQRFTRRSPDSCLSASCAKDVAPTLRCGDYGTASERSRIQSHIARAEKLAARRDLSALSAEQKLVRALLLECLREYREAGIFPDNRDFAEATPYFIDSRGVRCAMAHLLEVGGEFELVQKIARERNNATIAQLADEPRLLEWLDAAGLTVEEAAAIQPSYCEPVTDCYCYGGLFGRLLYPHGPYNLLPRVEAVGRGVVVESTWRATKVRITEVVGDCSRVSVGETITAETIGGTDGSQFISEGQEALVGFTRLRNGTLGEAVYGVPISGDNTVRCGPTIVPATADEVIAASMSDDCVATMQALHPRWAESRGWQCDAGAIADSSVDGFSSSVDAGFDANTANDVRDPIDVHSPRQCGARTSRDGAAIESDVGGDVRGGGCACSSVGGGVPPLNSLTILTALLSALSLRARFRSRVRSAPSRSG